MKNNDSNLQLVSELCAALRSWLRWDYEVTSARASGESVYSFQELAEMRQHARALSDEVISRVTEVSA